MLSERSGFTARALALCGILLLVPCLAIAEAPGAASPEALVARMKSAAESKNLGEIAACLDPKSRTELTKSMYMLSTMVVAFSQMGLEMGGAMGEAFSDSGDAESAAQNEADMAAKRAEINALIGRYNAVVAKHGLPEMPADGASEQAEPTDEQLEAAFAKLDQGVFLSDLMGFLESMPSEDGEEGGPSPGEMGGVQIGEGVLTGLKLDGDSATAMLDGEPVRFVRLADRWYFDATEAEGGDIEP